MASSVQANDHYPVTLSLAMLFYNEEANVESVVREAHEVMCRTGESFELVAIQNGSLDSTPQILMRLAAELPELRILVIPVNQGAGYGARKGWYDCRGRYVMGVSGDGQVDLQVIPTMFQMMRETNCEMAYGKRRTRPDGTHRAVVSTIYRAIMRIVFGIDSRDMNGLPKILHHKALQEMQLISDDHFFECEMVLKAARMGLRVCAMDVNFYARGGGKSSVGAREIFAYVEHLARIGSGIGDKWRVKNVPRWRLSSEWFYFPDGKTGSGLAGQGADAAKAAAQMSDAGKVLQPASSREGI